MSFTPTAEQALILEAYENGSSNLLLEARAGAAKTTTLKLLANSPAASRVSALMVAFNKRIADELQSGVPANIKAQTLNSVGHRTFASWAGSRLIVKTGKTYQIVKEIIESLTGTDRDDAYDDMAELMKVVGTAKTNGVVPEGGYSRARGLTDWADLLPGLELQLSPLYQEIVLEALRTSLDLAVKESVIDFDDQLYLPVVIPGMPWPSFDQLFVDEAQDLSPLNHAMIRKITRMKSRLIAVGDPLQAIYGFRGATENAMQALETEFDMRKLYLTVCFRSAESIVANARWRAPDMQWAPGARPGIVEHRTEWSVEDLKSGDAIICRYNAPLFRMAIRLIRNGLRPEMFSGDVIAGLEKIVKKLGKPPTSIDEATRNLYSWAAKERGRSNRKGVVDEKVECIETIFAEVENIEGALAYLDRLKVQKGSIKLMTGHKSKGLEFDRVWFLDRPKISSEGQDPNVAYVIDTRAREELYYVDTDAFVG